MKESNIWSVLRLVNDEEEVINIGVIVVSDDDAKVKFLDNWDRVQSFVGPQSMQPLFDYVEEMMVADREKRLLPDGPGLISNKKAALIGMYILAETKKHGLRIRFPEKTAEPFDVAIATLSKRFLVQ